MTTPRERIIHAAESVSTQTTNLDDCVIAAACEALRVVKERGVFAQRLGGEWELYIPESAIEELLDSLRVGIARGPEDQDQSRSDQPQLRAGESDPRVDLGAGPSDIGPEQVRLLAFAVVNCHVLARRALHRTTSAYDREKWEHVLRLCEDAGARSQGVLRLSLPTELTDGETDGNQAATQSSGVNRGSAAQGSSSHADSIILQRTPGATCSTCRHFQSRTGQSKMCMYASAANQMYGRIIEVPHVFGCIFHLPPVPDPASRQERTE